MAESFAAIEGKIGVGEDAIKYYTVQMSAAKLIKNIDLFSEYSVYEGSATLSQMFNRDVNESRAKKQIARYLSYEPGRFLPPFVVSIYGGSPKFEQIQFDLNNSETKKHVENGDFDSVGVLTLTSDPKYFVLDGQHRLAALRYLLSFRSGMDRDDDFPKAIDLEKDQLTVLFVTHKEMDNEELTTEEFRKRSRKIFAVLNRHAKRTTLVENITIDEDDLAAIISRELVERNDIVDGMFYWSGDEETSPRVNTKSTSLREGDGHLTTLSTLYEMNKQFITHIFGWSEVDFQFLHDLTEDEVEEMKNQIYMIWDELFKTLDVWKTADPGLMKNHTPPEQRDDDSMDHLLFWPVGQIGLAKYIATELDEELGNEEINPKSIKKVLKNIENIDWDMFSPPWKGYVLREVATKPDPSNRVKNQEWQWKMGNSGKYQERVTEMIRFLLGKAYTEKDLEDALKSKWDSTLELNRPTDDEINKMWKSILNQRKNLS